MIYNRSSNTYHPSTSTGGGGRSSSSSSSSSYSSTGGTHHTNNNRSPYSLRKRLRNIFFLLFLLSSPFFYWYWYSYTPQVLLSYTAYQYSPLKCSSSVSSSTYYTLDTLDTRQISVIDPMQEPNVWPKVTMENPYKKYGPSWGPGCIVVCVPSSSFGTDRLVYASQYLSLYQNNNERMNGQGNKVDHSIPVPTSSSSFTSSLTYYHPFYCSTGAIGIRYCGVVNAKYGGRSANAYIQYSVARYTASILNFGFKGKPIPGFGLLPEDIRDMCPPKVRWPWQYSLPEYRQLIQDSGTEERKGIENFYEHVLQNKQPRMITTDWYFEKSDIVTASILHGMRTSIQKSYNLQNIQQFLHPQNTPPSYESLRLDIHPWLPSKVIESYKELQSIMYDKPSSSSSSSSASSSSTPPELFLFQDEKVWDETIVVHVRIGDVGVWSWRRALIERYREAEWLRQYPEVLSFYTQYQSLVKLYPSVTTLTPSILARLFLQTPLPLPENSNNYSWFTSERWALEWFDFMHKDDGTGRYIFNKNLPGWEKFKDMNIDSIENKETKQLLLQFLEDDFVSSQHIVLPLSYYDRLLETLLHPSGTETSSSKSSRIKHVLIITESESVTHPLVTTLANKYNAYVQSSSVAMDFATLMFAKHVILSTSTFSWAAALLGRAETIHYPHAGYFSLFTDKDQCLLVSPEMDIGLQYMKNEMQKLQYLNRKDTSSLSSSPSSSSSSERKIGPINLDTDLLHLFTTFRDILSTPDYQSRQRIIYHDVYRMKMEQKLGPFLSPVFQEHYRSVLASEPLTPKIQQTLKDYQYCTEKFANQGALFLSYHELIDYYRDLRCAHLSIQFTDAARPYELNNQYSIDNLSATTNTNNTYTVPLCTDKFQDLPF